MDRLVRQGGDASFSLRALFFAQVAATACISVFITSGALLLIGMGAPAHYAGAPMLIIVTGGAVFARLHPLLLQRWGDKAGMLAYLLVGSGGLVAAFMGAERSDPALFLIGCLLFAPQAANAQVYRFVAVRQVAQERAPTAMATNVLGALFGGILGPAFVMLTADTGQADPPAQPFLVTLAATAAAALLLLVSPLRSRPMPPATGAICPASANQKIVSLHVCGAAAAISMNLIMVSGPLVVRNLGLTIDTIALAMMLHMAGMYAPSLFLPRLLKRFTPATVLLSGTAVGAASGLLFVETGGSSAVLAAITLIGVAWNLVYITSGIILSRLSANSAVEQGRYNFTFMISTAASTAASTLLLGLAGTAAVAAATVAANLVAAIAVASVWLPKARQAA